MGDSADSEAKITADATDLDATGDDVSAADADAQTDIAEDTGDTAADDVNEDALDAADAGDGGADAGDAGDGGADAGDAGDGGADADVEPFPLCPLQDGVCSGARASSADGLCTATDYGPLYSEATHPRICDGRDNNCDGVVDRECCPDNGAQQFLPGPYEVGDGAIGGSITDWGALSAARSIPEVVAAAPGAPAGATALVVWKRSATEIVAQHIDRNGRPVGEAFIKRAQNAVAAAVVATQFGYDLIWGEFQDIYDGSHSAASHNEIKIQALHPTLESAGSQVTVWSEPTGNRALYRLTAAHHDGDVLVGGMFTKTMSVGGPDEFALSLVYHTGDRAGSPKMGGDVIRDFTNMRAIATSSGLLLAAHAGWGSTEHPSLLSIARYSSLDESWAQFEIPNTYQDRTQFDLVQTGEHEFLLVFSKIWGSERRLTASVLDLSTATGAIVSSEELASVAAPKQYAALSLFVRGRTDEGFAEQSTLIWNEGGTVTSGGYEVELWTQFAAALDAQNPAREIVPSTVTPSSGGTLNVRDSLATVRSGSNIVAVWHTREATLPEKVVALPISFEGARICPENASTGDL